jgi:hypothetical protein
MKLPKFFGDKHKSLDMRPHSARPGSRSGPAAHYANTVRICKLDMDPDPATCYHIANSDQENQINAALVLRMQKILNYIQK